VLHQRRIESETLRAAPLRVDLRELPVTEAAKGPQTEQHVVLRVVDRHAVRQSHAPIERVATRIICAKAEMRGLMKVRCCVVKFRACKEERARAEFPLARCWIPVLVRNPRGLELPVRGHLNRGIDAQVPLQLGRQDQPLPEQHIQVVLVSGVKSIQVESSQVK